MRAGHAVAAIALGTPVKRASLDKVTTLGPARLPAGPAQRGGHRTGRAVAEDRHQGYTLTEQAQLGATFGGLIWTTRCTACELATASVRRCGKRAGWCARTGAEIERLA